MLVIEQRQAIIDETDGTAKGEALEDDEEDKPKSAIPSDEALAKFTDYCESNQIRGHQHHEKFNCTQPSDTVHHR